MLFGRSAWSELPLSTTKQVTPNGEEFDFGFLIDEEINFDTNIDQENSWNIYIQESENFNLLIDKTKSCTLETTRIYNLQLVIDENNTWELS
jgi:hypothetical protein